MKALVIIILIISFSTSLNSQSKEAIKDVLKDVSSLEQIEDLKEQNPDWRIMIKRTLLSDSIGNEKILNSQIGDILEIEYHPLSPKSIVKLLEISDEELCKAKYIYLDGSEYSKLKIDSLREKIIGKFNNGKSFESLVKEYNMDGNPNGVNWFYKGMMVEEFDKAVRNRKKGEIFTVDVKRKNWYYVVLKSHANKIEKSIKGIEIKCGT